MKPIILLSSVLLVLISSLTSCKTKSATDLIIHKWKLKELTGGRTGLLPDSFKTAFIHNSTIEFKKGNQFYFTRIDPSHHDGTYSISSDGKLLTTTIYDIKKTDVNTLVELTDQKLIYIDTFGNKYTYTAMK